MSAPLVCARPGCGHVEGLHDELCFDAECECVRFVEPITNVPDAVAALGALPVPQGPERTLDRVEDELTGASLALYEEELETARLRLALASAQRGRRELRARVAALLAERHSTNESVDDAAKALRSQRDRIAELEAAAQAARAVHVKFTTSDHCQADAERWPCPTVVALDVVSPAAPEPEPGACEVCGDGPSKWCLGCAKCSCVAEHDMGCARRVGEPA